MKNKFLPRLAGVLLALMVICVASSATFASATIVIENGDAAGVGFNDPTPVSPIGGNSGTTLGQQRLIAFQAAANIWGATLTSGPTITIHATWAALTCGANSAVLGSAGNSGNIWRDFAGAPFPATWYGNALANALSGIDRNGPTAEINAQFNVNIGTPGCLENSHWYYGLDNKHGATGVDLVAVLMHEFAHGLGFQTFTSSSTGVQAGNAQNGFFPSIYDRFLFDNTAGKTWAQMTTDAERQASAINTNNLVWTGLQVDADAPGVLSGTPRLRVNSPPAIAGNYQIGAAAFGPPLSSPGITANVVLATPNDGCSALTNGAAISGKIALIDRGSCTFVSKVKNAQNAGAVGVIIADNVVNSTPPGMGGSDPTITIPAVSITMADGNTIKGQLPSVNATLFVDASSTAGADPSGRPLMFTPNPVQGGSSVSHWDSSALPNQLMEPSINGDLFHSVTTPQDLTFSLLRDIGWCCAPPPPPTPPANNNFANAQAISGCSGSVNGTNLGATHESGEPSHDPGGSPSGSSVWYLWQAPSSGSVTMTTAGSNYDTLLAVYTGTSVNALATIAKNDDVDPIAGIVTSSVTFTATAGTVYQIAVDGWDIARGNITLNWTESGCTTAPTLLLEQGTGQAAALDSVTQTRGPFSKVDMFNFSSDQRTRLVLFTLDLGQSNSTGLIVQIGGVPVTIENVGPVPGQPQFSQIVVMLDPSVPVGTVNVTVTLNGATSNIGTVTITP
ncbi:MAG TPA: PA domain-containing protein [Pyrinomonadaceae bacterium]